MNKYVYFRVYCPKIGDHKPFAASITKEKYEDLYEHYCNIMSMMPVEVPSCMGYDIVVVGDWCDMLLIKRKVS